MNTQTGIGRGDTRFLPGEGSCKEASGRTGLDAVTNNLRLELERRQESFRAEEKPQASRKNKLVYFSGLSGGFSLCALRTAGPALPACPEAADSLLLQFAFVAFTALKEGFLLLF